MSGHEIAALGIVAVLGFWMLGAHNRLVRLRQAIAEAFAQVDALLLQRHQLLAELIAAAGGLLGGDAGLLTRRPASAGRLASLVLAEQVLRSAVSRVLALVQPAMHGDERLLAATAGLSVLQHRLDAAREAFNAEVASYNASVRQFPTHIVAGLFGFRSAGPL
jgi:LemA protein